MSRGTSGDIASRLELPAIASAGVLAVSISLWLLYFLDAYTLAFLRDASLSMMCF